MATSTIAQTRQTGDGDAVPSQTVSVLAGVGAARGVLHAAPGPGLFRHERHAPCAALVDVVEHFWMVAWDLRGHPPQRRETLPHPSVHVLIEHGASRVAGVASKRFSRQLEDEGRVFGIKFTPGGFRPFLRAPVRTLTDRSCALIDVFGDRAEALEQRLLAHDDMTAMIEVATEFLLAQAPTPDPDSARIAAIVYAIIDDRELLSVDQLARRHGIGKRRLQRWFGEYVGVSPKWVIMRYRLHEVLQQLNAGAPADWPALAQSLGYFDQAHFIRDFRRLVGTSPGDYVRGIAVMR